MKIKALNIAALGIAAYLSSCATTPDPAVVCTADWIKPRAAKAVNEFKRDTGRTLSSLSKNAAKLQNGEKLSAFAMYSMMSSLTGLVKKFETSRGLKDLKTLGATCDDPKIVKDGFMTLLQEVDAPPKLVEMFENLDGFERLFDLDTPAAEALPEA